MNKIIHYCWFGGKPLPKLALKCIKSWKKYLPDYEIVEWNESNFDVNITPFSKQAYDAKKWAFVSDVARVYALKEYGGIYFDTDMIVTKNISSFLDCELFAGWESEYNVAVGVLGVKHKNNELINKLWKFYSENDFSIDNMYSVSMPSLFTNILISEYGLQFSYMENQKIKNDIMIYARDYFYPISCDQSPNMFTDRTCMVHYYIGSWLSSSDKKRIKFRMIFGEKMGNLILNILVKIKHFVYRSARFFAYPYIRYRRNKAKQDLYNDTQNFIMNALDQFQNDEYVAFYNKHWLGTGNATKELFHNTIGITEICDEQIVDIIAGCICQKNIKLVIFSAFSKGWDRLICRMKKENPNIVIKVIWHGSHAMNVESYDWDMFECIFHLLDNHLIDSIGFVKESMYSYYKGKGYNVEFLLNTVCLNGKKFDNYCNDGFVKIGLYASGDRWVKNFYNQLAAASMFENGKIDCIPVTEKTLKSAKIFKTTVTGLSSPIAREKLIERMAKNDINFYVTFSECAPLIPLESLEMGVPCITSHNHHYWDGTELEKYLIVNENDNVLKIYEQANYCLNNKDKIIQLYRSWKSDYDKKVKASVEHFLNIDLRSEKYD